MKETRAVLTHTLLVLCCGLFCLHSVECAKLTDQVATAFIGGCDIQMTC